MLREPFALIFFDMLGRVVLTNSTSTVERVGAHSSRFDAGEVASPAVKGPASMHVAVRPRSRRGGLAAEDFVSNEILCFGFCLAPDIMQEQRTKLAGHRGCASVTGGEREKRGRGSFGQ